MNSYSIPLRSHDLLTWLIFTHACFPLTFLMLTDTLMPYVNSHDPFINLLTMILLSLSFSWGCLSYVATFLTYSTIPSHTKTNNHISYHAIRIACVTTLLINQQHHICSNGSICTLSHVISQCVYYCKCVPTILPSCIY